MPEWVGTFYREKSKPESFLSQYASVYNSVEGNTTFYNIPSIETVHQWDEKTPDGFKFCFKFPKEITHIQRLHHVEHETERFLHRLEPLRTKLGPFMIQLPESFTPQELDKLEYFLSILPKNLSYGVEVRHPDFFNHGKEEHALDNLLESYSAERIIFDTRKLFATNSEEESIRKAKQKKPRVPVRLKVQGSRPMVRYVGTNDILNNEAYLKEWGIVVADWIREGRHPYIFIHTPDQISQPVISTHFHKILSELIDLDPLPEWPGRREQQLGLF